MESRTGWPAAAKGRNASTNAEPRRERDRVSAEHGRPLAELEGPKADALAAVHAELTQTTAEQNRLAARIEEQEREHERTNAEHQRALADLQSSRQEALAECERVLIAIQQELRVGDDASAEIECPFLEVSDDTVRQKVDWKRLADFERPRIEAIGEAAAG